MTRAIEVEGLTNIGPPSQRGAMQVLALEYVDFAVRTGEVFGFLGPNGAGKTATVNILTILSLPSSRIHRDPADPPGAIGPTFPGGSFRGASAPKGCLRTRGH